MNADVEELHVAVTHLWLTSDAATVNLAREVAEAAAGVIAAHTGRSKISLWTRLTQVVAGPRLGDPVLIESARTVLAGKRERLVQHTRNRFDLQDFRRLELRLGGHPIVSSRPGGHSGNVRDAGRATEGYAHEGLRRRCDATAGSSLPRHGGGPRAPGVVGGRGGPVLYVRQ